MDRLEEIFKSNMEKKKEKKLQSPDKKVETLKNDVPN